MLKYSIYTIFVMISCVFAIPIQQQQQTHFEVEHYSPSTKKTSSSYIDTYKNLNELESYYSQIVNQVVDATVSEVIENAPETYLTIHQLQFTGREYCRIALNDVMAVLEYQLKNNIKDDLIASIRPLIENNKSTDDMIEYNQYMSHQLGLILNPEQFSQQIIQEVYYRQYQGSKDTSTVLKIWRLITDPKWVQTVQHELNESVALQAWLQSWLIDIEYSLQDEFDAKVHSLALTL